MESQRTFSWILKAFIPKGIDRESVIQNVGILIFCIRGTVFWSLPIPPLGRILAAFLLKTVFGNLLKIQMLSSPLFRIGGTS